MAIIDWTIGAAGDFATLALHRSSESGSPDTQRLTLLDDVVLSAEVRYFSGNFSAGVIYLASVGTEFKGKFDQSGKRTIKTNGVMTGTLVQIADELTLQGVQIFGGTIQPVAQDVGSTLNINNSGVFTPTGTIGIATSAITNLTDSISICVNGRALESSSASANVTVIDSIFEGAGATGTIRHRAGTMSITNAVVNNAGVCIRDDPLTILKASVSTTDATGTTGLINQTITNWYEDEPNDDYRMNSTGQGVLVGAGSGGSDIVDFYYVTAGGISVTATLGTIDYNSNDAVVGLTGSVDITATLGTISYSSNDTTVGIAGSVDVIATLGTIDYSSNDASIQISGETNVTATLGTIEYSSSDTVISLFGNVDVVATLGTISYDSNDVSIGLTGGVNVNATLGTIDYTSNDTVITLQGQVSVIATLGTISYDSNNVTIQVGTGQFIGTVTAGFADDLYSAGFKPSEITVSFKS